MRAFVVGLAAVGVAGLAGCGGGTTSPPSEPSTSRSPSIESPSPSTSEPSPTVPSPTASEASPSTSAPASPDPRYPDPASVLGQEIDTSGGPQELLVGGRSYPLSLVLGVCLAGTDEETCPRSLSAYQPFGGDDAPTDSHALLVLASLLGRDADGKARWSVVDATIVDLGRTEYPQYCEGTEGVVIAPLEIQDGTIPASAAWGVDGDRLVPVDPAPLSCEAGQD